MVMTYAEKLQDHRWIRRRWFILARDQFQCRKCGYEGREPYRSELRQICDPVRWLEVHHLYYKAGLEPWEYSSDALVTLCNVCHEEEGESPTLKSDCEHRDTRAELVAYMAEVLAREGMWPS